MFKLEQYKSILKTITVAGAVAALSSSLYANSAYNGLWNAKKDISGGVYYPIQDGQTGPY